MRLLRPLGGVAHTQKVGSVKIPVVGGVAVRFGHGGVGSKAIVSSWAARSFRGLLSLKHGSGMGMIGNGTDRLDFAKSCIFDSDKATDL